MTFDRWVAWVGLAPSVLVVLGCGGPTAAPAAEHDSPPAADVDSPGRSSTTRGDVLGGYGSLPPLEVDAPFVVLPVADHHPAIVSVPRGAQTPRPVLVATHGAGGRPEYHCEWWRGIVQDRAFILCPAGAAMYPHEPGGYSGFFYSGHPALGREMSAAFGALLEAFPEYVDATAPVYAGYSQGAVMGALLLPAHPIRFSRAVLMEGGFGSSQEWNVAVARRFADHGGKRVLLACGRSRCAERARKTARYLEKGGLQAKVVYARGAGHSTGDLMEREVRAAFPWVVAGDPRFQLRAAAQ